MHLSAAGESPNAGVRSALVKGDLGACYAQMRQALEVSGPSGGLRWAGWQRSSSRPMPTSAPSIAPVAQSTGDRPGRTLGRLVRYFLKLGAYGFGGPIALVGYMHRDLVERRGWFSDDEYRQGLALAQTMPGPLAAQLAMWLGYLTRGVLGSAAVAVAFVTPPFLLVTT